MSDFLQYAYARGFLISKREVAGFVKDAGWKIQRIGVGDSLRWLYYDPRNQVVNIIRGDRFVCILGLIIDPENNHIEGARVAETLLIKQFDSDDFWDYIDTLCGRFIIIYGDEASAYLLQDACGMRSCYYDDEFIASHYNLIGEYSKHAPNNFYNRYCKLGAKRPWILPGDITPLDEVLTLLPNNRINIARHTVSRFFPRQSAKSCSINDAISYGAYIFKKQVDLLSQRYRFYVSLTGGNDSRITLSALKGCRDITTLFCYKGKNPDDPSKGITTNYDNMMVEKLSKQIGFRFMQLMLDGCPDLFRQVLRKNHYHSHNDSAAFEYIRQFQIENDTILHLRSNILEIVRNRNYWGLKDNSPQSMAQAVYGCVDMGNDAEIVRIYSDYYRRNSWNEIHGYDVSSLFYMEERMGVWHAGGILLGTDTAIDTYCLFNQRKFLDMGMRTPMLYRSANSIVKGIINELWPEIYFDVPNTERTLAESESSLSKHFARWINSTVIKTNINNPIAQINPAFQEFGFANNEIQKDDFVGIEYKILTQQPKVHLFFVIQAVSHWEQRDLDGLFCEVKYNDEILEEISCAELCKYPLVISRDVKKTSTMATVGIFVRAKKDKNGRKESSVVVRVAAASMYFSRE